jgi:hypothetical protein
LEKAGAFAPHCHRSGPRWPVVSCRRVSPTIRRKARWRLLPHAVQVERPQDFAFALLLSGRDLDS